MTVDRAGRHHAREAALQMLYQWEVGRVSPHEAVRTYWPGRDAPPSPEDERADATPDVMVDEAGRTFANGLVAGTVARVAETDQLIAAHLKNWRIERVAVIDRLVMRLAIYELLTEPETPARVIINEALELARTFSGEEPVPLINGVLDAVRKTLNRE
ncbi:MAG TPA: transcription antitermination factor NusB [Vicinamibacterales bacterium]|nr:transcription antitermination factor NusB [Vicinamibacterales bacterium]